MRTPIAICLSLLAACASVTTRSANTSAVGEGGAWVDSVMASLSPRDKAAQLVWPQVFGDYTPELTPAWERVVQLVTREHVGGFVMSIGSPIETATKINEMQRLSTVPILFGADYEAGAGFRTRGGYF